MNRSQPNLASLQVSLTLSPMPKMVLKFPVDFPGRQVEKRMFPYRMPTAYCHALPRRLVITVYILSRPVQKVMAILVHDNFANTNLANKLNELVRKQKSQANHEAKRTSSRRPYCNLQTLVRQKILTRQTNGDANNSDDVSSVKIS